MSVYIRLYVAYLWNSLESYLSATFCFVLVIKESNNEGPDAWRTEHLVTHLLLRTSKLRALHVEQTLLLVNLVSLPFDFSNYFGPTMMILWLRQTSRSFFLKSYVYDVEFFRCCRAGEIGILCSPTFVCAANHFVPWCNIHYSKSKYYMCRFLCFVVRFVPGHFFIAFLIADIKAQDFFCKSHNGISFIFKVSGEIFLVTDLFFLKDQVVQRTKISF